MESQALNAAGSPERRGGERAAWLTAVKRVGAAGVLAAAAGGLAACGEGSLTPSERTEGLRAVEVAAGLASPVHLTAPTGDERLFVVEQAGRIRIVRQGQLLDRPFLDITDRVGSGGERGLLGLAFDPDYADSGGFWVNFTDGSGDTRVERFQVSASDPDVAIASSATPVLHVRQPFGNHNGGLVAFGPDGMLYVGMGDGGGAGDPHGHGQDRGSLLGALLRLDVRSAEPYVIPPDNPFAGTGGGLGEIWAYGLRNPWRFSFDPPSGLLFIADVGQNAREEINAVQASAAGLNYGWNIMEGTRCFGGGGCDRAGLTEPVHEYGRSDGCSVTGGHVYRGSALSGLRGVYFYSDYCRGWLRSFRMENGRATDHREWTIGPVGRVLSFGVDAAGELYMLSDNGRVYRLEER